MDSEKTNKVSQNLLALANNLTNSVTTILSSNGEEVNFYVRLLDDILRTINDIKGFEIPLRELIEAHQEVLGAANFLERFKLPELKCMPPVETFVRPVDSYRRNLVTAAISSLKNSSDESTSASSEELRHESKVQVKREVATTPPPPAPPNRSIASSRPKRELKLHPSVQSMLKRRCSMDMKISQEAKSSDKPTPAKSSASSRANMQKAMTKRHSNLRKTMHMTPVESDSGSEPDTSPANTDQSMHQHNNLYRTLCIFCNAHKRSLTHHYVTVHPEHEVPISRPSPESANKLRRQTEKFFLLGNKLSGFCYFCNEIKNFKANYWPKHIASHTGERLYSCTGCNVGIDNKRDHSKACGDVLSIFASNSEDGSLKGYMCKDCNFLQINNDKMIDHMETEHGYLGPTETVQFERVILVPALQRANQ